MSASPEISDCAFVRNSSQNSGGGVWIEQNSDDVTFLNCRFEGNVARADGGGLGGIMSTGTRLVLIGCRFDTNVANPGQVNGTFVGGGLYVMGDADIRNSRFSGNQSISRCSSNFGCSVVAAAGGAYVTGGSYVFSNCEFAGNSARAINAGDCFFGGSSDVRGAGLYQNSGSLVVKNSIFRHNMTFRSGSTCGTTYRGAGLFLRSGEAAVVNVTSAYNSHGGIYVHNESATGITNAIVYFNGMPQIEGTSDVVYSDVQGGYPGEGNISFHPLFLSETNLIIVSGSPAIDAGDPASVFNDVCFPPSKGSVRNDMGAHGGPCGCCWDAPCAGVTLGELAGKSSWAGDDVNLCIAVGGVEPFEYEWRYHGDQSGNAPVPIAGATNACLSLSEVQSDDAGYYSVRVSNAFGSEESNPARLLVFPVCFSIQLYPGLSITGQVGRTYCVQYTTNVSNESGWIKLTNFTLNTPTFFYLDPDPARYAAPGQVGPPRRFYRVIEQAP